MKIFYSVLIQGAGAALITPPRKGGAIIEDSLFRCRRTGAAFEHRETLALLSMC